MLGVNEHMDLKLFGREIIFQEFQVSNVFEHGTWSLQTDRRTGRQTTYCRITALCASIAR